MEALSKKLSGLAGYVPRGLSENLSYIIFGLVVVLVIYGLIQAKRGKIVVFANYTDVLCTSLSLLVPILVAWIGGALPREVRIALILFPFLCVVAATFAYNRISGFLPALPTKFFMVIIFVPALLLAFLPSSRNKYERKKAHAARQSAEMDANVDGAFNMIGKLVRSSGFVSLFRYVRGR